MILDARVARQVARAVAPQPSPSIWAKMGRAVLRLFGSNGAPRLAANPYIAAGSSRSKADWTTVSAGPNATVAASRQVLVARSRDAQRNDGRGARIVNVWVNNLIGTGLMPTAKHDDTDAGKALAAVADRLYSEQSKKGVLDNSGQHTAEGLQALQARALIGDGECYIRRIWDAEASPIPMRVAVYETDMLDESLTTVATETGNRIVQGIEINSTGRRVAYWFRASHPGETSFAVSSKSVRVRASDVAHLQLPGRPGQLRSVPILAPVLSEMRDLADFEGFTLIQKKAESLVVGVVRRAPYNEWNQPPESEPNPETGEPDVLLPSIVDMDGNITGTMRPGTWFRIEDGEDVTFNNPQLSGNYEAFKRSHERTICVGAGLSYEQGSGDFSNANYSTMRGGLLEFWAQVDAIRWHVIEPAQQQVWGWLMEAAWLAGLIDSPDVEAEWQAPRRQSIEPDKDVLAEIMQVRAKFVDEDDVIGGYGYNPERLREKQQRNQKRNEKYEIVSDADPSKYAFRGAFPPAVNETPLAAEAPGGGGKKP